MANSNGDDGKPNGGQTAPVDQVMVAMCQFDCTSCGSKIAARIPPYRVYNFPECSGIVMGHERLQACPGCGAQYVALIGGVKDAKIELVWKEVKTNASAIKAPSSKTTAGAMKQ